jgi:predicted nucleic acid-binding Zn finger protein
MTEDLDYLNLRNLFYKVRKNGFISIDIALDLLARYDDVALQALSSLDRGRAYRIRFGRLFTVNIFVGNRDYYIVIPESSYCGCISKYTVGIIKRKICYHIIAFGLLDALGLVKELYFDRSDFRWVMDELKYKREDMDL